MSSIPEKLDQERVSIIIKHSQIRKMHIHNAKPILQQVQG